MVSGSLRATDALFSTTAQFQILRAPTTSGGTTFGSGSNNNLLKSNGTSVYWTTLSASDIPNLNTSKLTEGVLGIARGGTGSATTSANVVFAGPSSGANAAPSFRALTAADIPDLSATKITSDTFDAARIPNLSANKITSDTLSADRIPTLSITSKTSGTLTTNRGGTGLTTVGTNGQVLLSDGNTVFWGEKDTPLETKTYTDVIATANNNNGGGFFYAKVHPISFDDFWYTKVRVTATIPSNVNYKTVSVFECWGILNTYSAYACQNAIRSTSYRAIYYNSVFFASSTGYNNGCGHWLGINLYYSNNPTDTSLKRTVQVELLDYKNCIVEFQDSLITPTNIPNRASHTAWYSSTNTSFTNFDACSQGLRETGDDNSTTINALAHANGHFVADSAVYRYQLLFHVDDDKLTPLNNNNNVTGTTKTMLTSVAFDPFKYIYYYATTTNVAAGGNIGAGALCFAYGSVDLRYTFNITTSQFTAHKYLYIKCSKNNYDLFTIAEAMPLVQSLPTTDDGYYYIFLGRTYNAYCCALYPRHPIFFYKNGQILEYKKPTQLGDPVTISHGGTGATTAANARTNLGLGSWALKSSGTGSDVGLGNVENTKLSTWTGTSNIKTVGTITSGTWNGAAIAASYIGNHSTDKLTSGTLPVARGGTGQTSIADIKTAINYGVTGQEVSINSGANNTNQNLQLCWTVVNSNSNLDNKNLVLVVSSSSISLYNSTDSTSVWTALSNKNLVTVAQGGTGTATAASNTVFAGPSSGSAAAPSFRALTTNDIPSLAASKITSGTFDTARIPTNISITGSAGISTVGTRIRTELTKGTNPSSTAWQSAWYNYQTGTGTDIADRIGGGIESYVNSSGLSAICLRAYKYAANSTETNSLEIQIAKDGTLSYSISSPQAFRQALGLGSNATSSTAYLPTTGGTVSGQLILSSATDVAGNAASESALIIGSTTGTHLALDGNEIMAKTDATSVGTLNINYDGGDVAIGAANTSYAVNIRSTKASSSSSTGALTIGGGIGAGGNIYSGANIYATRLLYAGFSTSTTEQQTGVASNSGSLYLYSIGNESGNGNRGLYAPAHGTGAATTIIQIDTNNNVTFNGSLSWSNITNRPANAGSEDIPIYWSNNAAVATNFSCTDQNYNDQLFAIWRQLDTRSYNTEYSQHKLGLVIAPTGIFCYDKTSSETIWSWKQDSNSKWVSDRATVLNTAREIYVNLSTTRDANNKVTFDGSADKAIHVSGTLPIARGGTGSSTAAANTVFAGPSSGSTTAPSFRALTTSDIPNLAASKITSGVFDAARIPTDINISGIVIKDTSLVKGTNPSAETWQTLWLNYQNGDEENIQDRVGGNIQSKVTTTGSTVTYIRAYQFTANSTVSNNFGVGIAKDGTMSYEISDPAKFRAALGLGSNATSSTAYLPLSSGTLDSYYLNIKPTSTGSSPWITFTFGNNTTSSNGYSTYNNYHTYQGDWNIMLFANRYELNNAWSGARMFFRSYSAKANSGERLNFYEEYRLPMASDGLSANAPYNILTTKNFNFFIQTITKTPNSDGNVNLEIGFDYYVLSIYNSTYSSSTRYIWVPFTPDDKFTTWWAHGMKNDSTHAAPTGSQTLTILYMKCTPY